MIHITDFLNDLYYMELERGRLVFEHSGQYRQDQERFSALYDSLDERLGRADSEAVWLACYRLANSAAQAAFLHGLRLGLGLTRWIF